MRLAFEKEDDISFAEVSTKLPYMLACIKESFRLYPPIPSGLPRRTPLGHATYVSGRCIPPNTIVSVHQLAAYNSPLNFHQPDLFLPERWLPGAPSECAADNHDVLQPFTMGPRDCIGRNLAYNEARVILAKLLWNFDLELCEESEKWIEMQRTSVVWEKRPLMVKLRERERSQ